MQLGSGGPPLLVLFVIVPWIGVMMAGYAFGRVMEMPADRRRALSLRLAIALTVLFVVLRAFNAYGDPRRWSGSPWLLRFLNTTKYPASLSFLLMTLGPMFLLLAYAERWRGAVVDVVTTFGRVPMFYYLLRPIGPPTVCGATVSKPCRAPARAPAGEAMRISVLVVAATIAASAIVGHAGEPPQKRLRAFQSENELRTFLRSFAEQQRKVSRFRVGGVPSVAETVASPAPAAAGIAGAAADSITNVQHAGVDEGGIVKLRGEHLVILRRGRLFTIGVGQRDFAPISAVNAFAPDIDPRGTWYDELLVSGDKVVVIGYSYARGGTEVGLFDLDASGHLQHRSTYHLRSNDYYSSRNYSSRLIGSKLILYTPLYLPIDADPDRTFPALRKWHDGASEGEFRRIAPAARVYRPAQPLDPRDSVMLHTVTTCELARVDLDCEASAVLGPAGRVFYVSPQSVYVWTTDAWTRNEWARPRSMVYALPLDGSAPGALQVAGSPVDQFSFLESEDGHLNVLVRSDARGDGMWNAEQARGGVALLRVPLSSFSDGSVPADESRYRTLPTPDGYTFQNRFVGNHLLFGTGSGWGRPASEVEAALIAVPWRGGEVSRLSLPHGVDRIEPMGSAAAVMGSDGRNLHFTTLRLNRTPAIAGRYVREEASQGELRSHGFFYKPDGESGGVLGLPIRRAGRPGYEHLFRNSAAIVFLRNDHLRLREVGELAARTERVRDDRCRASCVDWYGNARPLFVNGRIFALLGYELVEGRVTDGRLEESRRISYAPPSGTM